MEERTFETIRHLSREDLEAFAFRATLQMRRTRIEVESGRLFVAVLTAFLVGALMSASAFLVGAGLG